MLADRVADDAPRLFRYEKVLGESGLPVFLLSDSLLLRRGSAKQLEDPAEVFSCGDPGLNGRPPRRAPSFSSPGSKGKRRLTIGCGPGGTPSVLLSGQRGDVRIRMEADSKTGAELFVLGQDGKVIWKAPGE
jgi:hypothetical protein